MYLPQLSLFQKRYGGDEIFFDTDQTLMHVLMQNNPVYLVLELPGLETKIVVCFPAPTTTRVYADAASGRRSYFIGESEGKHPIWTAPAKVNYRYGMSLLPWMFLGYLDKDILVDQDHVVNYIVLNCGVGRQGVNIRLHRTLGGKKKRDEWIEIHQFHTGSEYHFAEEWKKQSRMITRFVPDDIQSSSMTWQPEGGWAKYRQENIPSTITI